MLYEITPEKLIDLDLLEVVFNFLYEMDHYHPAGFWALDLIGDSFCGYGFDTLREALEDKKDFKSLIFVLGFKNFIITAKTIERQIDKISIKFYLTKGTFPYIDTLDWIYKKLRLFWLFLGYTEMPQGKEIILKNSPTQPISDKPLKFTPTVLGKIYWSNNTNFNWTIPKILIHAPPAMDNTLSNISPWFSTCNHGFLEKDTDNKTKFGFFKYNSIKLPDVTIVTIILHTA